MAGEGSYPFPIHPALSNRWVVPSVGVEPTRPCGHLILSQTRLPVSPRGILIGILVLYTMRQLFAISLACKMIIVVSGLCAALPVHLFFIFFAVFHIRGEETVIITNAHVGCLSFQISYLVANLSGVVVDGVAVCGVGYCDVLGDRLVT